MMRVFVLCAVLIQFVLAGTFPPTPFDCAFHYVENSSYSSGEEFITEVKGMQKGSSTYLRFTHIYDRSNSSEIRRSDIKKGDKCAVFNVYSSSCEQKEQACSSIGDFSLYSPETGPIYYDSFTSTPCPNNANGCTKYISGGNYVITDQKGRIVVQYRSGSTYTYTYLDDPPSLSDFSSTKCSNMMPPTVDICSLGYSSETSKQDSSDTPAHKVYNAYLGCSFHASITSLIGNWNLDVKGLKVENNGYYMLSIKDLSSGELVIQRGDMMNSLGYCFQASFDEHGLCDKDGYSDCVDYVMGPFEYETSDIVACPDGKRSDCKKYCYGAECVIADAKGRCVNDGSFTYTYLETGLPSLSDFKVDCDNSITPAPTESHCRDSTETSESDGSEKDPTSRGPVSDAAVTVICIGTGVVVLAVIIAMFIVRQVQIKKVDSR